MAILAEKLASMVSSGVNELGNGVESNENVEDGEDSGDSGMGSIKYGSQVRSMCEWS
jgi:hypothetical protein